MADPLATYVHDHLAGAQIAVSTLEGLRDGSPYTPLVELAEWLLAEVQTDREVLQEFSQRISGEEKTGKETAAWLVQRASHIKLAPDDPLGSFEALELICLGIQGKLSLWHLLKSLQANDERVTGLDLDRLIQRAEQQHARAERIRIAIAGDAFAAKPSAS